MKKIVSIGMLIADVFVKPVDAFPKKGQLQAVESCAMATGGCALNTAVGLARLGENASVIGMIGEDIFASFIQLDLKAKKVDASYVIQRNSVSTTSSIVLLHSDGERSFLGFSGALKELQYDDLNKKHIFSCDIVHIGAALVIPKIDGAPLAKLLQECKNNACINVVDTCWDASGKWHENTMPILPYTDYFMPSYEEAKEISGLQNEKDMAQFFYDNGACHVVIKMGKKGSYVKTKNVSCYVPAICIENPVDTTGAGDSFMAGFICGISHGWDIEKSALFASAVASFIVEEIGANNNAPEYSSVIARLAKHGHDIANFI